MLKIQVFGALHFDESSNEFVSPVIGEIELEHSLASLSKWESHWEVPFISSNTMTEEQVLWYIKAMSINPDTPPELFDKLTTDDFNKINTYIGAKQTATWFSENPNRPPNKEIITAELIYYWMVAMNIPFECQYWHLNRLLTLIKVCEAKSQPPKKISRQEAAMRQRALNQKRREQMGTRG